jgi:hypothetical protein
MAPLIFTCNPLKDQHNAVKLALPDTLEIRIGLMTSDVNLKPCALQLVEHAASLMTHSHVVHVLPHYKTD